MRHIVKIVEYSGDSAITSFHLLLFIDWLTYLLKSNLISADLSLQVHWRPPATPDTLTPWEDTRSGRLVARATACLKAFTRCIHAWFLTRLETTQQQRQQNKKKRKKRTKNKLLSFDFAWACHQTNSLTAGNEAADTRGRGLQSSAVCDQRHRLMCSILSPPPGSTRPRPGEHRAVPFFF